MQAVRQVVFTDVLIVDRLDVDGQNFAPIGLHKTDAASDWLVQKACRVFSYKTNRVTWAIGVILAFTRKRMFYFNQKSEVHLKKSKTSRGTY